MNASGLFPSVGRNHQEMMWKQLEKIKRGGEISQVRDRRMQQDARINHQLEMDRARVPGLRGAAAARMNANNVAEQIN